MTSRVIDIIILFATKRFCIFQWFSRHRENTILLHIRFSVSIVLIAEYFLSTRHVFVFYTKILEARKLLQKVPTDAARSISYMEHISKLLIGSDQSRIHKE